MKKFLLIFTLLFSFSLADELQEVEKKVDAEFTLQEDKIKAAIKESQEKQRQKDLFATLIASFRAKLFDANLITIKESNFAFDEIDKKANKAKFTLSYNINFDYDKYESLTKEFKEKLASYNFKTFSLNDSQAYMSALKLDYDFKDDFSYIFILTYNQPAYSVEVFELPFKLEFDEDLDINTQSYDVLLKVTSKGKEILQSRDSIASLYSIFDVANAKQDLFSGILKEQKNTSLLNIDKYLPQKANSIIIFPYFYDTKEQNIVGLSGNVKGEIKSFYDAQSDLNFNLSIAKAQSLSQKAKSFFKF